MLPPCVAFRPQLPTATKVTVVPATVHTEEVLLTMVTGCPELADGAGLKAKDPVTNVVAGIVGKVMVWAACLTVKLCVTGVAAA